MIDERLDPQHGVCGWPASAHGHDPGGPPYTVCPDPPRQLCGSCDAGLPMSCVCVEPPKPPHCYALAWRGVFTHAEVCGAFLVRGECPRAGDHIAT